MASGWNPEAAYTLPGKSGLPWVCTSAGVLGVLNNVLPFCGESRHMGLSLVSWGPSVDFNMVIMDCTWANTMVRRAAISWVSFFLHMGCTAETLSPRRLGLRQGRTQLDLGESISLHPNI